MNPRAAGMGIVAGGIGLFAVVDQTDKAMNYTEVEGTITELVVDCYLENDDHKLVDKETDKMAYMDCEMAPFAAARFGYEEKDIKRRASVTYAYVSPVDQQTHTGDYSTKHYHQNYEEDMPVTVFAHKKDPAKSRFK